MTKARRILVLTLSFGSGHVRAARAVACELKRLAPDAEVRTLDALEGSGLIFRALYVWPYRAMLMYAPSLWKKFFESRVARRAEGTAPAWGFRRGCPRVFEEIERFGPDCIVAVEVAACEMAAIARRARMTEARIVNVITDHEAEPVWVKPEVALYAVADERVREQLCAWGAARSRIVVAGIPTDAAFAVSHDTRATRARFGAGEGSPLVLLMGGGQGPTRMDEVAARLCRGRVPMCVVAIAGGDARARRRLGRIKPRGDVGLRVLGWTDEVAALMHAAALLVTKPGGLTLSEAARCGLPVVMFDGIPGPETLNAERFASAGAGVVTRGADETAAVVERLLLDEPARAEMSARSRQLARPRAAEEVARLVLNEQDEVINFNRDCAAFERGHRMTA
jgi:processive 1,2-diacylglycerol beta-glucosyltransferase